MARTLLLVITLGIAVAHAQKNVLVEVSTRSGNVTGYRYQYDVDTAVVQLSKTVDIFLGIPFAEPPIGDRRFGKPVPVEPWEGSLNCTEDRAMCWQVPIQQLLVVPIQDEDCLFLNIWSPDVRMSGLPVMVWFHGGAFVFGSGSGPYYEGLPLAAFHDVIIVTVNYRLSVFGFLFANDASPGNYGLFDQQLALTWVKDNIAAFGGDPERITIFGQSAGGASVGLQILAEQSQDLFNQAIMLSGSMLNPWGVELDKSKALRDTYQVGDAAGCDSSALNDYQFVECLREKDAQVIIAAAVLTLAQVLSINIPFVPIVDGDFLKDNPHTLLDQGLFKQCDIMTGTTRDDGTLVALVPFLPQIAREEPYSNYTEFHEFLDYSTYVYDTPEVLRAIEQEYIDWSMKDNVSTNYFDTYVELTTDESYYCPSDEVSRQFRKRGNKVYRWLFNHMPTRSIYSVIPLEDPPFLWKWRGIAHAEDIPFVFGVPFRPNWPHNYTEDEMVLSMHMMRYYANFAKTGNPNQGSDESSPMWEEFDVPGLKLMELKPNPEVIEKYHADHCHFWNDYVLKLVTFTAGLEKVQEEWNAEFNRWRTDDVMQWRTEFEQYEEETEQACGSL